jgi:stress-induced morphogen
MAKIRGKSDSVLKRIAAELTRYESEHPRSAAQLYRQNPAAIRIRIVDPSFASLDRIERDDVVWKYLNKLPGNVRADITVVLLLTPDELETSFANQDFEHPVPSRL